MEYSVNHVWTSNILLQFVLVNDVKYSMGINPSQYSSTLVSLGPGAEPVWALAILAACGCGHTGLACGPGLL